MNENKIGLIIKNGEREELLRLCLKESIHIKNQKLFDELSPINYLWCLNCDGIDEASIYEILGFKRDGVKVIRGIDELKDFLKSEEWSKTKN